MPNPIDSDANYLLGKIDAVTDLAAALAAHLSPAIASVLLAQCVKLREKAATGTALTTWEQGYLSAEQQVLLALKQAADAEKIRSVSGPAQH